MASCQSDAKQSHKNCSKAASQKRGLQACTGIEDFGIALHHLEEANWVLMDAVNRAIPQDGGGGVDPVAEGGGSPPRIVGPLLPQRGSPPPEMEAVGDGAPSMPQLLPSSPPRLHTAIQESISAAMGPGGLPGSFSSNLAGPGGIMSGSSGMMGGAGVSISSDFLPMGSSTRSRMLELNVEYRDRYQTLSFTPIACNLMMLFSNQDGETESS